MLGNVPNVADIITSWSVPMLAYKIEKKIVNRELVESRIKVKFDGVPPQPLTPQQLLLKPEGQRDWKFYTLFTKYAFDIDDVIEIDAVQYRVLKRKSYRNVYGYWECELIEDYRENAE